MCSRRLRYVACAKGAGEVLLSGAVGLVALSGSPRLAPLLLLVPLLWLRARGRAQAFCVALAYHLAVSRGLFRGAAVFLSDSHTPWEAVGLWFLMALGVSLPFGIFWASGRRGRALCLVCAYAAAYFLPPVALIGVANPLVSAACLFPGWGYAGLALLVLFYALCIWSRRFFRAFFLVALLLALLPQAPQRDAPEFAAIDTSFGKLGSGSASFLEDFERAGMVFADLRERGIRDIPARYIVLPETIAGRLNPAGVELWRSELTRLMRLDQIALFGAELPVGDGKRYDNVTIAIRGDEVTYSPQRIPVPYSMYRGPFARTGARLHLWDAGIPDLPDGRRVALLICYEAFLTWPYLLSMFSHPDAIVCQANLWWCRDTSLPATARSLLFLWGRLFGLPVVLSLNA